MAVEHWEADAGAKQMKASVRHMKNAENLIKKDTF